MITIHDNIQPYVNGHESTEFISKQETLGHKVEGFVSEFMPNLTSAPTVAAFFTSGIFGHVAKAAISSQAVVSTMEYLGFEAVSRSVESYLGKKEVWEGLTISLGVATAIGVLTHAKGNRFDYFKLRDYTLGVEEFHARITGEFVGASNSVLRGRVFNRSCLYVSKNLHPDHAIELKKILENAYVHLDTEAIDYALHRRSFIPDTREFGEYIIPKIDSMRDDFLRQTTFPRSVSETEDLLRSHINMARSYAAMINNRMFAISLNISILKSNYPEAELSTLLEGKMADTFDKASARDTVKYLKEMSELHRVLNYSGNKKYHAAFMFNLFSLPGFKDTYSELSNITRILPENKRFNWGIPYLHKEEEL